MSKDGDKKPKNDNPPPATQDTIKKGLDVQGEQPKPASQDVLRFAETPPSAKQEVMFKMLTKEEIERLTINTAKKGNDKGKTK